jgi:hypothetical protein
VSHKPQEFYISLPALDGFIEGPNEEMDWAMMEVD